MTRTAAIFIVIDGIDGAGKSNAMTALRSHLEARNQVVECTREPGGTPAAEKIRDLLVARDAEPIPGEAEVLLMYAARSLHLRNFVVPALNAGKAVICDRFSDATYAYQGAGRGLELSQIDQLEQWIVGSQRPDLVLILDLPLEEARSRADGRGEGDRFDDEADDFRQRVRQAYLDRAAQDSSRYRIIDASADPETVRQRVVAAFEDWEAHS